MQKTKEIIYESIDEIKKIMPNSFVLSYKTFNQRIVFLIFFDENTFIEFQIIQQNKHWYHITYRTTSVDRDYRWYLNDLCEKLKFFLENHPNFRLLVQTGKMKFSHAHPS